ncbi:MAG: hypothetical protein M1836_007179 [Candelina mexicana]|nr:MAG: hypothetical protein M1836_007179 [Candelina mexicana]
MSSPNPWTDQELADLKQEIANGDHGVDVFLRKSFKAPCFCYTCCQNQYIDYDAQERRNWTYTDFRQSNDTTALARSYTESIMKDSAVLRQLIGTYGNRFVKWWRRWTVTERKGILLRVRPKMYAHPHPHIDLGFRNSLTVRRGARSAYLLPYINLESLSSGYSRLVCVMHNRAKHGPEEWVLFDNETLCKAWWMKGFEELYAEGCIIMYGAAYGRWIPWDEKSVHRGDAFGAPRAMLILEAQAELMKFLREIFSLAVADADIPYADSELAKESMKTQSRWYQAVTAGIKAKHEQQWIPFTETLINQPFLGPPVFDIDVLTDIAETRAANAQDRLWLLRTEPSHFFENATYIRDHISTLPETELYDIIANQLFQDPMLNALGWRWILTACQHVKVEYIKHRHHIGIGSNLPQQYGEAMSALQTILVLYTEIWTQKLGVLLCMMPEFQTPHKVWTVGEGKFEMVSIAKEGKLRRDLYSTDRILWCLVQLCKGKLYGEAAQTSMFDYPDVLSLLDSYLVQCSHAEAARLDQTCYSIISDMAAAYQMLNMLGLHRPTFVWPVSMCVEGLSFIAMTDQLKVFSQLSLGRYILDLDVFRKQKGKKELAWLTRADAARSKLDAIWKVAIALQARILEVRDVSKGDRECWTALMMQGQTAMYTHQAIAQRTRILARRQSTPVARLPTPPIDTVPQIPEGDSQSAKIGPLFQLKQKTRPSRQSPVDSLEQLKIDPQSPLAIDALPPIIYTLKENSMQTMRKIIPDAEDSTTKGTVDWADFVGLMDDLGFRTEHRGGSAFTFKKAEIQPSETQEGTPKMSIVIHKPHPSSEMVPIMLKGIGRRFARRFGWSRGLFRCAKEETP